MEESPTSPEDTTLDDTPLAETKLNLVESNVTCTWNELAAAVPTRENESGMVSFFPRTPLPPGVDKVTEEGQVRSGNLDDDGGGGTLRPPRRHHARHHGEQANLESHTPMWRAASAFRKELEGPRRPAAIRGIEPVTNASDGELVVRFRNGDRDAFSALYRTHHAAVFRFALYLTGDREQAAEVTQEVFVWLVHHPATFNPERGDLPAFLGGVARQMLRRRRREAQRWCPLHESAAGTTPPPEIADDEETTELWKAIASLPDRYREAVILCDLEEMSNEQAAGVLGCAVGTIWSRLHRAHELLQRKLQGKLHCKKVTCSI
jgi:RNA polymerase sigma-70 factor (ECF subfamily)